MQIHDSFYRPFRRVLTAGVIAAGLAFLPAVVEAGPKGTVNVRALGNQRLTIDGNIAD